MTFRDRKDAGRQLAARLSTMALKKPIVFGLARGGIPVAREVALALGTRLEVLIVRKIGAPGNPEFGIGAITEGGFHVLNENVVRALGVVDSELQESLRMERGEVERRAARYRKGRPLPSVKGRTVILVDDGLATGVSAQAGALYLKQAGARKVILAMPVCARDSAKALRKGGDQVVCLEESDHFFAVGMWYDDFSQLSDREVVQILDDSRMGRAAKVETSEVGSTERPILSSPDVLVGEMQLPGLLTIPSPCLGLVLFVHGSGSSRLSPRNMHVAEILNQAGIGTLLFDLLTENESFDRSNVFDIPFLANRLVSATRWLLEQDRAHGLPVGYFGASTGAAAALWAVSDLGDEIAAVVSRGGRPDLAIPRLGMVKCPTLLIVGGEDTSVISMNREAMSYLSSAELVIIPGATHLFEEPGALDRVAASAAGWFTRQFAAAAGVKQAA